MTVCPPERRATEVKSRTRLGAYDLLAVKDPAGPAAPDPGQFYMLASGDRWGGGADERPYLPRAFSYARARPWPGGGAELEFLLEDVGPGTHRLGELDPGDVLMVLGPLGRGFGTPAPATRPLLVGGGIGAAPILCLADALGPGADVILGFRGAEHARAADLFAGTPVVVTEDGSAGAPGLVTEPLAAELDRDPAATVFACGPPAMLEAVRALCAERGVASELALEAGMACGFGACFGCVVPTRDGYARVCVDGPVFEGGALEAVVGH